MKKVLFYAGLLALATACSEEEFLSSEGQNNAKGITFVTADAETRMQWDDTGSAYSPFWYAEQDRIGLFGLAMKKGAFPSPTAFNASSDGWNDLSGAAIAPHVVYKATQSKKNGVFTSVDDANTLHFNGKKTARILAVYPSTVKANYAGGKIVLSSLPAQATQDQTTTKGQNKAIMMYDFTTASKVNDYDAVGEKVQLAFQRPMAAIVFKTANANAYTEGASSVFGNLQKITIETKGYDKVADGGAFDPANDIASTKIAYASTATLKVDTLTKAAEFVPGAGTESSQVVLTLDNGSGLAWNDDALAIAAVKNVDRKAFREKSVSEAISVVYSFANIDIESKTKTVSADFKGFMEFPALDINAYDYLVTKGESGSTRTLIVNGGKFSDIFDANNKIKWADSESRDNGNLVARSEIKTVIINSNVTALTDAEFAILNGFGTQVTSLTLNSNTEIKANALKNLTGLTEIDMQNVTKIGNNAFNANLAKVILPAYNFEDLTINPQILKKANLKYLDMSGVSVMNAGFPAKGLSLQGYTLLETVIVKDGLKVGANAFNGCSALKSVTGKIDLVGTAAFKDCDASGFTTINIMNTDIPANTFEGCANLKNVKKDGNQVAPTSVGTQAFKGCAALEEMNLANATEIGAEAFMDCKAFLGTKNADNGKNVLYVGAAEIKDNTFAGCVKLEYVYFKNATTFGLNILGETATNAESSNTYLLKEVKFGEAFTPKAGVAYVGTEFGGTTKVAAVKLFVNPNQGVSTLDDNKLVLPATYNADGSVATTVKIAFTSITKEAKF